MGAVNISEEVIAIIAGIAAVECYGLVGMASRKLKDGIYQILGKEDIKKGVEVSISGREVTLGLYIVVGYGVNIAEVAKNVIERVKYNVENQTGLVVKKINVNVQGVKLNT
ncbi:Asp23/Gls24 family envelope stress response protein [Phosphitispora sp. TUW77]|uniref:Asp23/Gls24 family envelope stress response protein n=1 Tax=Phosphitispora sp. TUW77 TaxID=3152361 RepID=UPI003AB16C2A